TPPPLPTLSAKEKSRPAAVKPPPLPVPAPTRAVQKKAGTTPSPVGETSFNFQDLEASVGHPPAVPRVRSDSRKAARGGGFWSIYLTVFPSLVLAGAAPVVGWLTDQRLLGWIGCGLGLVLAVVCSVLLWGATLGRKLAAFGLVALGYAGVIAAFVLL